MPLTISPESPLSADGCALIEGSQAALLDVFSPDEIFTFSPEELATPDVTFLVARDGGLAMGCVAMVDCGTYAEVKRLYVPDAGRGRGTARALMAALERQARAQGKTHVMLETGDAPGAIVEREGLKQVTDTGAIEKVVDDVLGANPTQVEEIKAQRAAGHEKPKTLGWMVGQIMKASGGKANPAAVNEILMKKLGL